MRKIIVNPKLFLTAFFSLVLTLSTQENKDLLEVE